jgi:hypothetical protein
MISELFEKRRNVESVIVIIKWVSVEIGEDVASARRSSV